MVTGFEDITEELTPFEKEYILPYVVQRWEMRTNDQLVSMSNMIQSVTKYCEANNILATGGRQKNKPYRATGPRMRKIIHHIRVHNLVPNLIATSKGYFKTDDPKKIRQFIKSCKERANSFLEVASYMDHYAFLNR